VAALSLFACGGKMSNTPDASLNLTGGGTGSTGGGGGSTGGGGGTTTDAGVDAGSICTVSTSNFADAGAISGEVVLDVGMNATSPTDDFVQIFAPLEATMPGDLLAVELYADYPPFEGNDAGIVPGTYEISGEQLNYATCGVCVRVLTNATSNGYDDSYLATGGTLTITANGNTVGQPFTATFTNIGLRHVNIDDMTFESTAAADNCRSTLGNASVNATITAAQP
jgi:hypothetical protein